MKKTKSFTSLLLLFSLLLYPQQATFAASGDNAVFSFIPLHGFAGENEVRLKVNTDGSSINHLIFDIADAEAGNNVVFNITGSNDPVDFPLHNQSVLGTEATFTSASGDLGYDLASGNPANVGSYSALYFATLIADETQSGISLGGTLSFDTDTAIYVNGARKGTFSSAYTVLPNEPPEIQSGFIGTDNIGSSIIAPDFVNPAPSNMLTDVSVQANFSFTVDDPTDASVNRTMKIFKITQANPNGNPNSPTVSVTQARSGSDTTFSYTLSSGQLEYSTYYKLVYSGTDDQGAIGSETYYFSTQADGTAPNDISKASMTLNSDSNTRTKIISQISFTTTTDNDDISYYYLWSKNYLENKNIFTSAGERDDSLDTNGNSEVSDEEFFQGLRNLIAGSNYITRLSKAAAGAEPLFRITGTMADRQDTSSYHHIDDSLNKDVLYVVAADNAVNINGEDVPNFSEFKTVDKIGDIFGAQVVINGETFVVGDGSLDVWDSIQLYRNAIGLTGEYPILESDKVHSSDFNYDSTTSKGTY